VEKAFAGPFRGSAGEPSESQRTVDGIVGTIGERTAAVALRDPAFRAYREAGNMTSAGTRFHTLAKHEADRMVRNGEIPAGYELWAELTVRGEDGHSRLDILVRGPDGSLHERDWKTTVMSGLEHKVTEVGRGEMARHQQHVEHQLGGQRLTSQESRSWVPLVHQAENREAKRAVDGVVGTVLERAASAASTNEAYKGHVEAGNVIEADRAFHTIAKQEADRMVRNGEIPEGYQLRAELTVNGKDGRSQLNVRVTAPESFSERDWSATVKSGSDSKAGEPATRREYSWSSSPTVRQAPSADAATPRIDKPRTEGPKVDGTTVGPQAEKPNVDVTRSARPQVPGIPRRP
jgi:hypothetical protein